MAVNITGTLDDGVAANTAKPGDTLHYEVTITNTGSDPANNVSYNETHNVGVVTPIDATIEVTPIAFDDNGGSLEGNTPITFNQATFLANDVDPDGAELNLDIVSVGNAMHGTVSIDTVTGIITFTPETGYEGAASFEYTVVDEQGHNSVTTGVVSLTVTDAVWYVDSAAAPGGDGSFGHAFQSLAALTTGGGSDGLDDGNDTIFIYNRGTDYSGQGIVLEAGQKLLGDGSTLTSVNGNTIGVDGNNSDISNNGGLLVTLSTDNTISGLDLGNSSTAVSGTGFGTLTINTTTINTNGEALDLTTGAFGAGAAITSTTASSGTNAVNLTGVTGSVNLGTGTLSGSTGATFNVSGGTVATTYSGGVTQANNAALLNVQGGHTGTLTFNTGTLSATNGTGLQFSNADGTYNFNGTTTLNGGDAGVDIAANSGGTFSFGTNTSITHNGNIAPAFLIDNSDANVTYSGNITDNNGRAVDIFNHETGTVTFQTGTISSASGGIRIQNSNSGTVNFNGQTTLSTGGNTAVDLSNNNGGGTVNFNSTGVGTGSLNITTTSGQGFLATGGGTVTVQGTGNTISSGSGTALNIANTTIGTADVTFQSISANGAANGIVLNNTGTSGGLTVTGDGLTTNNGSGGTIQNTTGTGISLTSTRDVSLDQMNILTAGGHGIDGNTVTNFTLTRSNLTGNGDALNEEGANFVNLWGTAAITDTGFNDNETNQLRVQNSSGTLTRLSVTNTTLDGAGITTNGNFGILFAGTGNASMDIFVDNADFQNLRSVGFHSDTIGTAQMDVTIQNSEFRDNGSASIDIVQAFDSDVRFNVLNNPTFVNQGESQVISVNMNTTSTAGATLQGQIVGNTIGNVSSSTSATPSGGGIVITSLGAGDTTVLVDGNTVRGVTTRGIVAFMNESNTATSEMNLTITDNNVDLTHPDVQSGIEVIGGGVDGDQGIVRADILNNTVANAGTVPGAAFGIRVVVRGDVDIQLPGYTGGTTDNAAVDTYLLNRNVITDPPEADPSAVSISRANNGEFTNTIPAGSAVPLPTLPSLLIAAPGGVEAAEPADSTPLADTTQPADTTDNSQPPAGDSDPQPLPDDNTTSRRDRSGARACRHRRRRRAQPGRARLLRRRRHRALERGRADAGAARRAGRHELRRRRPVGPQSRLVHAERDHARRRRRRLGLVPRRHAAGGFRVRQRLLRHAHADRSHAGAGREVRPAHHRHARDGARARAGGQLRRRRPRRADVRLALSRRAPHRGRGRGGRRSRGRDHGRGVPGIAGADRRAAGRQGGQDLLRRHHQLADRPDSRQSVDAGDGVGQQFRRREYRRSGNRNSGRRHRDGSGRPDARRHDLERQRFGWHHRQRHQGRDGAGR